MGGYPSDAGKSTEISLYSHDRNRVLAVVIGKNLYDRVSGYGHHGERIKQIEDHVNRLQDQVAALLGANKPASLSLTEFLKTWRGREEDDKGD